MSDPNDELSAAIEEGRAWIDASASSLEQAHRVASELETKLNVARHRVRRPPRALEEAGREVVAAIRRSASLRCIEAAERDADMEFDIDTRLARVNQLICADVDDRELQRRGRVAQSAMLGPALDEAVARLAGATDDAERQRARNLAFHVGRCAEWPMKDAVVSRTLAPRAETVWRAIRALDAVTHGPASEETAWSTKLLVMFLDAHGDPREADRLLDAFVAEAERAARGDAPWALRLESESLRRALRRSNDDAVATAMRALLDRIERAPREIRRELGSELRHALMEHARRRTSATPMREQLLREAVAAAARDHGRPSQSLAWALRELATFLRNEGRLDEARRQYALAREMLASRRVREDPHDPPPPELVDRDLVELELRAGHTAAADARLRQLEQSVPKVAGARAPDLEALRARVDALGARRTDRNDAGSVPLRLRHPKLGVVGEVIAREGGKVTLRLEDGSERVFLADRLVPAD